MERRSRKVILTLLTKRSLAQSANHVRVLRGSFMPYFSVRETGSLPKYWSVRERSLKPLSRVLWTDIKASNISRELPYLPMPNVAGFEELMAELSGYLAIRLASGNTFVCLGIFKTVR